MACSIALGFTMHFASYLPITKGWVRLETLWFPLAALNLVFHEAGHLILGLSGIEFLRVIGGTLMQLLLPIACIAHFRKQESPAGVAFAIWWLGVNLAEISWYAADAKLQALILITGMSGREGGGHDWGYILDHLGLLNHAVGIGQLFFFLGLSLMVLPLSVSLCRLWTRFFPAS